VKTYQVFRAVTYIYEVEAESMADAEKVVVEDEGNLTPVAKIATDDIYTQEI
jgi:hypothetical protein